jgi:DNA-binding NarL/FixJ family response regulator
MKVEGAVGDGEEAVRICVRVKPDVVLMDLRMPRLDGVAATSRIVQLCPQTRVIALTTYADEELVFEALRAGARGYLTKESSTEDIFRAIESVRQGHAFFDPSVQGRLLEALTSGQSRRPLPGSLDGLSVREMEVLLLIARGLSNREIADTLHLTEATIKSHVNNILNKTGLRDRAQAVAYAFRNGLVPVPGITTPELPAMQDRPGRRAGAWQANSEVARAPYPRERGGRQADPVGN